MNNGSLMFVYGRTVGSFYR